jgi:hypothetical protein
MFRSKHTKKIGFILMAFVLVVSLLSLLFTAGVPIK